MSCTTCSVVLLSVFAGTKLTKIGGKKIFQSCASLLLLCPRTPPCAWPPPLLRCSTRPAPRSLTEAHTSRRTFRGTPENVGRQGLRQSSGSICWQQADKGSLFTSRDTTALLAELQALHHTHREATRLFLMAASQGATEAKIAHALRQQPQGIGIHAERGKKSYEQKKRTRTTSQATQTQPLLLAADAFAAALEAIPAEDWCRRLARRSC
jgi:hypothetical protein